MPSDLWYFYECDLNKGGMRRFLDSLPYHLERMFKDSFGGLRMVDKCCVLQGYRGPHTDGSSGDSEYLGDSNGLQEVRYWWGATKSVLLVPHAWPLFGAVRALQNTDWHSLYFDSKTEACLSHNKNEACKKLNHIGHQLFQEGKYTEAGEYHSNAYKACSSGYKYEQTFKNDRDRAQEEADAANLNSQGNRLFSEGKYTQALSKYQEAYDKSQVSKEYNKYKANKEKAQAEIDAINLNSEGDNLFNQGKYTEALSKYREAYDKSQISEECNKYSSNKNKAQAEIDAINTHRVSILDTLWKNAWEAENDTANDRSGEAKDLFHRVLSEAEYSSKIFPGNLRFKQYEILALIKIDGNELFNEGLEAQQDGSRLLQEAQELKLQQKFESALIKYREAESKFYEAQEKFKTGSEKDQRFVSCIEFVKDQLNDVLQSIEVIEQHALSSKLFNLGVSISKNDSLETDFCQSDRTRDQNDYYSNI